MTLLVIRILSPDDYGLMAISQVVMGFVGCLSNLGLGDALIQRDDTPRPVVASVFGVLILLSLSLTMTTAIAAYPIADWYDEPRLIPLIQVASIGFLLSGLTTLPRVYLLKNMQMRPMFILELSSGLMGALSTVGLAYTGFGVWSLMLGGLIGHLVRVVGMALLASEYFVKPSFNIRLVRPLMSFGIYRTLEYTLWVVFVSADVLIIGWQLTPADLGFYAVALNFAAMPLNKIAPIINQTAFPAFALIQNQPAEARFYVLKAMRLMCLVTVPVFFGISAVAPEVVDLVFGPQWLPSEPLLAVLALAMSFRAILLVIPSYLQGIGNAKASFWCNLSSAVLLTPLFIIGCYWGTLGVSYAWLLGYPFVFVINALIASRYGKLSFWHILSMPVRPMAAGAAMMVAVAALRPYLHGGEVQTVILLVLAGAAVYSGIILLAFRPLLWEFVSLVYKRQHHPNT